MRSKIRKGDKVVVIAGNDKGKSGEVIACRKERVLVQGVNIRKKHVKRQQKSPSAGIIEMEAPIHISNVAFCDTEGKPVKAKVRMGKDGAKELFYLDGAKEIVLRQVSKQS